MFYTFHSRLTIFNHGNRSRRGSLSFRIKRDKRKMNKYYIQGSYYNYVETHSVVLFLCNNNNNNNNCMYT